VPGLERDINEAGEPPNHRLWLMEQSSSAFVGLSAPFAWSIKISRLVVAGDNGVPVSPESRDSARHHRAPRRRIRLIGASVGARRALAVEVLIMRSCYSALGTADSLTGSEGRAILISSGGLGDGSDSPSLETVGVRDLVGGY
jgi:hypothetical protein